MSSDAETSTLQPGVWTTTTTDLGLEQRRGQEERPSFNSAITSDRLRESEKWPPGLSKSRSLGSASGSGSGIGTLSKGGSRRSVFKEIGLEDYEIANTTGLSARRSATPSSLSNKDKKDSENRKLREELEQRPWYSKLAKPSRPMVRSASTAPPATFSTMPRVAMIAFLIAIVFPGIRYRGTGNLNANVPADGVGAGLIRDVEVIDNVEALESRADSPTDVCLRWSHQSAVVNGTLYVYGGQAKMTAEQTSNTWNNDFLTLDLTKSWAISQPSFSPLPQPSGPPAVANGYLWNSFTSLFLYGGLFSDTPPTDPTIYSTWEYSLTSSSWIEHASPKTTAGNNSDPADQLIQRSAEGAGLSVPELGLSWYFGGHQDMYTTAGWSNQIARIYLRSLLEFTHPGYMNDGVQGLGQGENGASSDGAYRNITQGGIQDQAGFTERADGVLIYVPGWGTKGILLGLAGGTNETFTEMNVIDVYDIASTTWYKQATSGTSPSIRVDPCAVVFAAPDASSFNIYLYGGQNLQPYKAQTQYTDMWILTIPSFTWIQVDMSGQSQPPARAGHTCHAWDGQLVVVGGYVGAQLSCDNPIYVFNASSLQWQNSFTAISGGNDQNEQATQDSQSGLTGSYGYIVPDAVQSVVGGGPMGSATATTPASGPATSGPIATGHPPTFTVTQSGSTVVQTAHSTSTSVVSTGSSATPASSGPNLGAIIAGVLAGVLAILAAYLAFCTWLYRRQLRLYKNHVAMSQRTSLGYSHSPDPLARTEKIGGPLLGAFGTEIGGPSGSNSAPRSSTGGTSNPASLGPAAVRVDSSSTGGRPTHLDEPTPLEYRGAAGVAAASGGLPAQGWGGMSDRPSANSSTEDLLAGHEPSFISVVLSPRRTLRVINQD